MLLEDLVHAHVVEVDCRQCSGVGNHKLKWRGTVARPCMSAHITSAAGACAGRADSTCATLPPTASRTVLLQRKEEVTHELALLHRREGGKQTAWCFAVPCFLPGFLFSPGPAPSPARLAAPASAWEPGPAHTARSSCRLRSRATGSALLPEAAPSAAEKAEARSCRCKQKRSA